MSRRLLKNSEAKKFQLFVATLLTALLWHPVAAQTPNPDDVTIIDTRNCSRLRSFILHDNGDVLAGAANRIYHFRAGVNSTTSYNYATGSCNDGCGDDVTTTVAEVRADTLILDDVNKLLIVCGNATSGLCFRHNLSDVCAAVSELGRGAGADNQMYSGGASVGVAVQPHDKRPISFYFARTTTGPDQQSISAKEWRDDYGGFRLRDEYPAESSMLAVQPELIGENPLYFHYAFERDDFVYFLLTETVRKAVKNKKAKFAVKIARLCTNDDIFASYVEIQLKCLKNTSSKNTSKSKNLVVVDAQLVDSTLELVGRTSVKRRKEPYLIVLYGVSTDQDHHADQGGKRFLCVYSLKEINKLMDDAVYKCNRLTSEDQETIENPLRKYPTYPFKYADDDYDASFSCADTYDENSRREPSMCPNSRSRNTYKVIAGPEPLEVKSEFKDWAYQDVDTTRFTSIAHGLRPDDDVVLFLGGDDGRVYLHSKRHHTRMRFLPYVTVSTRPVTKLLYDVTGDSLLAMDDTTLRRIPLERFCLSAASCGECLQRKDIGCGFCATSGRCEFEVPCIEDGEWTQRDCVARIHAVQPTSGPREGETSFQVIGSNLACPYPNYTDHGDEMSVTVPLWGITPNGEEMVASCEPKWSGTDEVLSCESKLQKGTFVSKLFINTNQSCGDNIKMIGPGRGAARADINFTFVDVQVDGFAPRYGIVGTVVSVRGRNLDHSEEVVVVMDGRSCNVTAVVTRTEITCVVVDGEVPGMEGTWVKLDGYKKTWSEAEGFEMLAEPVMNKITASLRSIVNGGCEYILSGKHFLSTSSNTVDISKDGRKYAENHELRILNDTHLSFLAPSFQSIPRFTNISFKGEEDIKITFKMDGYKYKYKTFAIYPNTLMQMAKDNKFIAEHGFVKFSITGFKFGESCPKNDFKFFLKPEYPCGDEIHCDLEMVTNKNGNFLNLNVKEEIFQEKIGSHLDMSVWIGPDYSFQLGKHDLILYAKTPVYVIIIIVIIITALLIAIVCWRQRRRKKTAVQRRIAENGEELAVLYEANNQNDYHHTSNNRQDDVNSVTMLKRLEISEDIRQEIQPVLIKEEKLKINFDKVIGKGHFGTVYEGSFVTKEINPISGVPLEERVAVKTLSRIDDVSSIEKFLQEGLIMRGFKHENVLTLVGICMEVEQPLVVLPYMEHGDLLRFIRDPSKSPTVKDLVWFGIQACKGMTYLSSKRFVHRDLAARNCMLDSNLLVKVADFGLARDIYEKEYYKIDTKCGGARMPIKWMALESLMEQRFTTRSDVWSFGVLLWELMTRGVTPYPDVDAFDMLDYLKEGRRLRQPEFCPNPLYQLMLGCWGANEDDRPAFPSLVDGLQNVYEGIDGNRQLNFGVQYVNTYTGVGPSKFPKNSTTSTSDGPVLPPRNFSISKQNSVFSNPPSEPGTSRMMSHADDDVIINHDQLSNGYGEVPLEDGDDDDDDATTPVTSPKSPNSTVTSPNRVVAKTKQFPERTESYDQEGYLMPGDVTNSQPNSADDVTMSPPGSDDADDDDERRYENFPFPQEGEKNRLLPLRGDISIDNSTYTPMTGSLGRDHHQGDLEKARAMTLPLMTSPSAPDDVTDDQQVVYTQMGL